MPRQKKTWLKAEYWAAKIAVEVAQAAFSECDAIGIEIDDGVLPEGLRKFADDRALITAYFERSVDLENVVNQTMARFFAECGLTLGAITFSVMEEDDWQANFVRSCTTFKVEPNIFIVPSFEIDAFKKNQKGDLFVEMDPENAFGTGQHQTTKLCLTSIHNILTALDEEKRSKLDCLDVGTGSGILAILMKKLGVGSVLASETDDDALVTAQKNAAKNGVNIRTLLVDESYIYQPVSYDLVVANILAPVLIAMVKNLLGTLKPGGLIILSGILVSQADDVIDSYVKEGAQLLLNETMADWCSLLFKKDA